MKSPAELWEEYQPRIADAEKLDRDEATLVFLIQPIKLGRFWIAPLTLKRLLYLEALHSPFVGRSKVALARKDVLTLLWVMHPKFSPSAWRGKLFSINNYFVNWQWYGMAIGELIGEAMAMMGSGPGTKREGEPEKENPMSIAQMLDGFCSQYHWPLDTVLDTPLLVMNVLGKAMATRLAGSGDDMQFSRHADGVRAEFLKESGKVNGKAIKRG